MPKIAVVTTSRADYGHLVWPLRDLRDTGAFDLKLIALGAQLSPEFGDTFREIEADGFTIDYKVECLLSSDTDVGMAKTIGVATLSLADILGEMRPDLLLLIADRYEMLAPASVALSLRIPIAHIEGGEISEGAIDQAVRDALTMMSHLHFVPTESSRQRVLDMGEEPWRVHRTGAPSIDHLFRSERPGLREVEETIGYSMEIPPVVVAFHPVTLDADTIREATPFFEAIDTIDAPIIFSFPNQDSGCHGIIERAEEFCARRADRRLCVNLPHLTYWALLENAAAIVGNSSSGIMEAPSLRLPTVNVGRRQQGRERAANVIDAPADREAIVLAIERALSGDFRESLEGMTSPYGEGDAGRKIAEILTHTPIGKELLEKRCRPSTATLAQASPPH